MSEIDYYSEAAHGPHEIFDLGNYQLESGITLPNARIAYKTHRTVRGHVFRRPAQGRDAGGVRPSASAAAPSHVRRG